MFLFALSGCGEIFVADGLPGHPDWVVPDPGVEPTGDAPGVGFPFDADRIWELEIDLPASSVDGLERGGDYVPATVHLDGLSAEAGVRLKGSSTFDNLDGKPSLKVNFGAFTPGARFLDVERITLNAMRFDPTMLREATAYRLFGQVGVPGPRHRFATVAINGTPYGLYSLIETLDENFLERAFPEDPDGNLYDSTFIAADLTSLGVGNFELQEGAPLTPGEDLHALVDALNHENILDVLDQRFDRAAVLGYLAMDLVTSNWDGYSRNTNNYLLYHATTADRWYFVPWGQDTAFRGGGPLLAGVRSRVTTACLADSACKTELLAACRAVLATWTEEDLHGWAAALSERIGPHCAADPRREKDCDFEDHLEALVGRPEELARELGP